MGIFNKLNKGTTSTIKEGIDLAGMEFRKLKDFVGDTVMVDGFYFSNKSKYGGEQVIVIGNGCQINMPSWAVDDFKAIQQDPEMLAAMFEDHLSLTNIKESTTKNGNSTTTYEYTDC